MAKHLEDPYGLIQEQLHRDASITECMLTVTASWQSATPNPDWEKVRAIDFDGEFLNLRDAWLSGVLREEPPIDFGVTGLWFGLHRPYDLVSTEVTTDFCMLGSPSYELDSDGDWASVPPYRPKNDCAKSRVLAALHRLMESKSDVFADAFEFVCLAYVAFLIKHLLGEVDRGLIVRPGESVGVAMGWNSGDILYIGSVTRTGFHPRDVSDYRRSLRERQERFENWFKQHYGNSK
jgi:hypothetical protein